jgi:uncharacterized protein (TIGR02217 family)
LIRRYSSGGTTFNRDITKPLATGMRAWVDNSEQQVVYDTAPSAIQVAINTLTGIVTLGATHIATTAKNVEVSGEFDVPVRFDTDSLDVAMETFDAGAISQLPIMEVRGE